MKYSNTRGDRAQPTADKEPRIEDRGWPGYHTLRSMHDASRLTFTPKRTRIAGLWQMRSLRRLDGGPFANTALRPDRLAGAAGCNRAGGSVSGGYQSTYSAGTAGRRPAA